MTTVAPLGLDLAGHDSHRALATPGYFRRPVGLQRSVNWPVSAPKGRQLIARGETPGMGINEKQKAPKGRQNPAFLIARTLAGWYGNRIFL
jgi:hypothetical protein